MDLIIASNNKGKIAEYKDILAPLGYQVFSQAEKNIAVEVEETGSTFEENAALKARAIYDLTKSCVIADDSGLMVEALNGEPGIYSARYKGLPTEHERRMAVLEGRRGAERLFTGTWKGTIAFREEGTNGFGYDPIFISEDADGRTTASMPISFKEQYSHRAKAVKQLVDAIHRLKTP